MKNYFSLSWVHFAIVGTLLLAVADTGAAEIADLCWKTEKGTILRFSLTQSGSSHYTYTGLFDDGDGITFAIIGEVAVAGSTVLGSFSGSKSSPTSFKTGIYQVSFSPTLVGSAEGIRQVYDRASATTSTDYRIHTLTPTVCP